VLAWRLGAPRSAPCRSRQRSQRCGPCSRALSAPAPRRRPRGHHHLQGWRLHQRARRLAGATGAGWLPHGVPCAASLACDTEFVRARQLKCPDCRLRFPTERQLQLHRDRNFCGGPAGPGGGVEAGLASTDAANAVRAAPARLRALLPHSPPRHSRGRIACVQPRAHAPTQRADCAPLRTNLRINQHRVLQGHRAVARHANAGSSEEGGGRAPKACPGAAGPAPESRTLPAASSVSRQDLRLGGAHTRTHTHCAHPPTRTHAHARTHART